MAVLPAIYAKEDQRYAIHFLSSEGIKPSEIDLGMENQCTDAFLSLHQVYK